MYYYEVAPTQIVRADSTTFTYVSESTLPIGQIVHIEVGKKEIIGIIMRQVDRPAYATKSILSPLAYNPVPAPLLRLAEWMAEYYATHLALCLQLLLPRGIQKKRRHQAPTASATTVRDRTTFVLNKEQRAATREVINADNGTFLLHGVTGSGKTAVYIELAKQVIKEGKAAIILVPEIALTTQLVDEFSQHFDEVVVTHSKQTEAERHKIWEEVIADSRPRIVIGPRSALLLPLTNVGLIVVDEAHEPSFKQEQSPRYSAIRAASKLVEFHKAKLILGSATPSVADYYLAEQTGRSILTLSSPAQAHAKPAITLVDMTKREHFKQHRFFSDTLLTRLESTFAQGKQALIFHNRRGSASTTLCENCGWQAGCPHCFVPLTLHADEHMLRCHICGFNDKVPTSCPSCHHAEIIHKGIGTKLIESELRKIFPDKTIVRFDADSDKGTTVDQRYKELYTGSIDLIIGTQVVAKGLDLPHLRTVGIVQADAGLSLPDFSSSERTFQLIAQVVGRVGRNHHETDVIIQSYQPTHPAVTAGIIQDYPAFYAGTIKQRQRAFFPPFCFLLKLTCQYKTEKAAISNAQKLAKTLRQSLPSSVEILGPTPAFYERQRDTYRWQLVLKSTKRSELVDALQYVPPTHWQSELDPMSLL
jgi:primosomal protein N' (replication factor Y) (superfamily II helicase)